ncbi:AraC family transcriptional regulator ligand-binding domain-containing protein [Yoonia sp. SS1-5]|uniref:AraC family transcriptional regulator ligand-binding domain-containing protein n=1 Tax=Yoonia rhodophyticola TaxID=3137370 RepID=A0AAN0NJ20_9RHOB
MKVLTVAAGLARTYIDYAERKGADRVALLSAAGLTEAAIVDQDDRLPLETYRTLILAAKDATGDPAFVLHHAMDTELRQISVVGLIVHSAKSMADSMVQLNRYAKLMVEVDVMDSGERFSMEPCAEGVWVVDNRPDPNSFPELTEANYGRFVSEFSREFPDHPFALAIEVTHPAPSYAEAYERVLRCPVTFNAQRNAMLIGSEWLEQEFDDHIGYVFGIYAERADALLARLETEDSLRARIEALVLPELHKGEVKIDTVARDLGMSRQTLYRRLKDEGVTFAQILDDLRCRMASDYLSARKASVNETAYLVGFSEASSFVRAFRRWTGMTPVQYRGQQHSLT